ncbi:MAG: NAD(P)/FAD-dependent oxidoreductase [Acidimicrobiales bacterium]
MTATEPKTALDAVIVGAGFSGLYMLHKLRNEMGLTVRVIEAGGGVGGTWWWNRYPGARSDSDSYIYGFMFDEELWKEWRWTERYPEQQEVRAYLEHVAQRYDLLRDITFNTRVQSATFDEHTDLWSVATDTGETVQTQHIIAAVGTLSVPNTPTLSGADTFGGESYHTGLWPHDTVDFTRKRVGIVGTGASAVQAIPIIAQEAAELTVFQRTANYILPANHGPVPEDVRQARLADYAGIRERLQSSPFGHEMTLLEKGALESTDEEVHEALMERWDRGGFGIWVGGYPDILTSDEANAKVREFLHARIKEKVHDPETARMLTPNGYPFGVKRVPLDSGYFETFNLPNVHLVDVKSNPIAKITSSGVKLQDGTEYELDAIVYATGFDAMTGPLTRIDIRGRGGQLLRDKWEHGPRTYLGLTVAGFPNLFTITGPQSPSVLSNMPVSIEQHVDLISTIIAEVRDRGATIIEPSQEAEDAWVEYNAELVRPTLFETADTWYMGANIPGKPRVFMPHFGLVGPYRERCNEMVANDFEGFVFDANRQPAALT